MTSLKIYEKNNKWVCTYDKFVYIDTIYLIWKCGASLIKETYYASETPINPKKKIVRKRNCIIQRFFDLKFAPENYLINNGFKIIENE